MEEMIVSRISAIKKEIAELTKKYGPDSNKWPLGKSYLHGWLESYEEELEESKKEKREIIDPNNLTFSDIGRLDNNGIKELLKTVDSGHLGLALGNEKGIILELIKNNLNRQEAEGRKTLTILDSIASNIKSISPKDTIIEDAKDLVTTTLINLVKEGKVKLYPLEKIRELHNSQTKEMTEVEKKTEALLVIKSKRIKLNFEDIVKYDDRDVQRILRDVPNHVLTIALAGSSIEIYEVITNNLSHRRLTLLLEDLKFTGLTIPENIYEDKKQEIVSLMEDLEATGEINIIRKLVEVDLRVRADIRDSLYSVRRMRRDFADIIYYSNEDIRHILRKVNHSDLILALSDQSIEVFEAVINNLDPTITSILIEDIKRYGDVRIGCNKRAKQKIVTEMENLEKNAEITCRTEEFDNTIVMDKKIKTFLKRNVLTNY